MTESGLLTEREEMTYNHYLFTKRNRDIRQEDTISWPEILTSICRNR